MKKSWEEEKRCATKREERVIVSYKEFEGFRYGLQRASQVAYEYGYRIASNHFKAQYPELEVDEDPFAKLSPDTTMFALAEISFDNCQLLLQNCLLLHDAFASQMSFLSLLYFATFCLANDSLPLSIKFGSA